MTGRPVFAATSARIFSPASMPTPRNAWPEVRLALSNDALNTSGTFSRSQVRCNSSARPSVKSRDSMTQGPAMTNSGLWSPTA